MTTGLQIDLSTSLTLRAFGEHGVPTTFNTETWLHFVKAIDACQG